MAEAIALVPRTDRFLCLDNKLSGHNIRNSEGYWYAISVSEQETDYFVKFHSRHAKSLVI